MTGRDQESVSCCGTYNVRKERNGGIDSALWRMDQTNIDLGLFQGTKVTYGIHTHALARYCVFVTVLFSRRSGGVSVFYRYKTPHFQVEEMHQHRPNVLSFQVASGGKGWFIVGCFLLTEESATTERVITTIPNPPHGQRYLWQRISTLI